jgi:F-type H+-transporting ATPase subunit b
MISKINLFDSITVSAESKNTVAKAVNAVNETVATAEGGKGLGIDLFQIVFYILCFIIAMVVLQKFLFSAIIKILDERQARIDRVLDEHDELEAKLNDINNEAKKITDVAKVEARTIIENAKKDVEPARLKIMSEADATRVEILATASNDAKKILDNARATAESEGVAVVQKILTKSVSNMKLTESSSQAILSEIINKVS